MKIQNVVFEEIDAPFVINRVSKYQNTNMAMPNGLPRDMKTINSFFFVKTFIYF